MKKVGQAKAWTVRATLQEDEGWVKEYVPLVSTCHWLDLNNREMETAPLVGASLVAGELQGKCGCV